MAKKSSRYLSVLFTLLFSALIHLSYAQAGSSGATGIVNDDGGHPLSGVTVSAKTNDKIVSNTLTDSMGKFKFSNLSVGNYSFTFSIVGYQSQTLTGYNLKQSQTVSMLISMVSLANSLNDVVVVGYGTQQKDKVTGSIATINMDQVGGDRPNSSLASLLQGVSPGLQVSISSGQPGASASLNIRGATDFTPGTASTSSSVNSTGPFILVDNVPFSGGLNMIDPADIATVTVLKDAGAAAIYGARSAYGVILITTKQGKHNQKTQLNYNNNFTVSTPMNLPQKVTAQQQIQALIDGGMTGSYYAGQNLNIWDSLIHDYNSNPSSYPGGYSVQNGIYYQLASTDALHQLLGNNAFQQTHNLSISGGSDKTTYRLSGGYTNENGIILPSAHQDNFTRYNVRGFVSTEIKPWWTVQLDATYNYTKATTPKTMNSAFTFASSYPALYAIDTIPGIAGFVASPANVINNTVPTTTDNDQTRITGRTILKPVKGLTVTGEYTIDNQRGLQTSYDKIPVQQLLVGATLTPYTFATSQFSKTNSRTNYSNINLYANYQKSFGLHHFALLGGFNQEESHYEQEILAKLNPINPDLPSISTSTGNVTGDDNYLEFSNRGFFYRLNYDYKNKYLIQVNARNDGSSKFPEGHHWGFFPSASVGWRVTEEGFMKSLKPVLNEFKLRGSLGQVGNQAVSDPYGYFASMLGYNPTWLSNYGSVLSLTTPGLISSDFTWEKVQTLDFGADWALLRSRFTGTFDWYQRDTKGVLTNGNTTYPATLGTAAPLLNVGGLRTKGFELQLNWQDKVGQVSYYVGANLFNYKSFVTSYPSNSINSTDNLYANERVGSIWGYTTDRFYTTDDFVAGTLNANLTGGTLKPGIAKLNNSSPNPGDILYKDLDTVGTGNGIINAGDGTVNNPGDRRIIGNSTPQFQYGFNGGLSYKGFDFSFVMNGVLKRDLFVNNVLYFPNNYATYSALYTNELNYWTPTNPDAFYGRIYTDGNAANQQNNQLTQTKFLQNGAFLRIRNITLRYNFPASILKSITASKLQIFFSMENVATFDHMAKGSYPDVTTQGTGAGNGAGYPFMRKSSVGINVTF